MRENSGKVKGPKEERTRENMEATKVISNNSEEDSPLKLKNEAVILPPFISHKHIHTLSMSLDIKISPTCRTPGLSSSHSIMLQIHLRSHHLDLMNCKFFMDLGLFISRYLSFLHSQETLNSFEMNETSG